MSSLPLRKSLCGRYFRIAHKGNDGLLYRAQDERDDPEYSPEAGVFIWPDGVNNLWWISKLPVIDMSSDSEWDNAGIIGCIASDWKKVWVPWNHREESKLEVMPAMYYEAVQKARFQIKLRKWQDWWMAGGRNEFLELPPRAPPPPPKGEPGVATVGKGSSPSVGDVPPTRLIPKQPQPPKYPPPPRAADVNYFVLKPNIAAGVKEEDEASGASGASSSAKAPAVRMQPPMSTVPKAPPPLNLLPTFTVPPVPPLGLPKVPPPPPLVPKPNPNVEPATGWKSKMVALLGALEMNLTTRVQYLVGKFLD